MQLETCEICGQHFVAGYGYSLGIFWLVTGHARIGAFCCEKTAGSGQHWGCSPEHAMQAAETCLREHMALEVLKEKHNAAGEPRYAPEDEQWASGKGENFHFLKIEGGPVNASST